MTTDLVVAIEYIFLRLDLKEERDTDLQNKLRYSMETMLYPIFWQSC